MSTQKDGQTEKEECGLVVQEGVKMAKKKRKWKRRLGHRISHIDKTRREGAEKHRQAQRGKRTRIFYGSYVSGTS